LSAAKEPTSERFGMVCVGTVAVMDPSPIPTGMTVEDEATDSTL